MGLITRFGEWIDAALEPKASVDFVFDQTMELHKLVEAHDDLFKRLQSQSMSHESALVTFCDRMIKAEADVLKLRDELNAIKALYQIGSKRTEGPKMQKFDGSEPWKR